MIIHLMMLVRWWWWWWWWWTIFVVWLTEERRLALFQLGPFSENLTIANLRHAASRIWTCEATEFRLIWWNFAVVISTTRQGLINHGIYLMRNKNKQCLLSVCSLIMSRARVNPHSIVAWWSRNFLLEASAKSEV